MGKLISVKTLNFLCRFNLHFFTHSNTHSSSYRAPQYRIPFSLHEFCSEFVTSFWWIRINSKIYRFSFTKNFRRTLLSQVHNRILRFIQFSVRTTKQTSWLQSWSTVYRENGYIQNHTEIIYKHGQKKTLRRRRKSYKQNRRNCENLFVKF